VVATRLFEGRRTFFRWREWRGPARSASHQRLAALQITLETCCIEAEPPRRLAITATGDFNGIGVWTLEQDGGFVNATFDWRLTADKPLLRYLSFLFKPFFSANHRWAMARGEQSLKRELVRRSNR